MARTLEQRDRIAAAAEAPAAPLLTPGFLGLLLAWFAFGLCSAPAKPLLPVYVDAVLHRPPLFTSTLLSLQLASGALGALVGGSVADAAGRKLALLVGSLAGPLAAVLFLTRAPLLMLALSLVLGMLSSIQTIGGQTYLMGAVRQVRLGFASALFFIGSTLGTSLGNLLAAPALDRWGFNVVAAAMIVASFLTIAMTARFLPAPPRDAPKAGSAGAVRGYATIMRRREVRLLIGLRCMPTCYWGAATLLVPLLLYRVSHLPSTAAFYSGLSLALAACCQILTGRLADRVGRRFPAVVLTTCIVASALLLGLFSGSLTGLYVFGIFGACSAWSLSVLMPGLIKELSAPGEEGRTLALTHFVWSGSMLLGSVGAGALVVVNSGLPFLIAAMLNVAAVAFAVALLRSRAPLLSAP